MTYSQANAAPARNVRVGATLAAENCCEEQIVLEFDPERVCDNVRKATTEDLLDRVTVYRNGMEPDAIEIIEGELQDRRVYRNQIRAHAEEREREVTFLPDGTAISCSFCHRPAVAEGWGWHWLRLTIWGEKRPVLPLMPRFYHYCSEHQPAPKEG